MSEFAKKWEPDYQPVTTKIREAIRPPGPLKPRVDMAVRRIEVQIQKLDRAHERFSQRDESIFSMIVNAYSKHDVSRASILANELAEIRRMRRMIMHARLALEQIVLRLKTVSELGDIVTTLTPAVTILRSIRAGISGIFPEAEKELGDISNILSGVIIEAGQSTGLTLNFEAANEDARKILDEAAKVAEERVKERLPELPSEISPAKEEASLETR